MYRLSSTTKTISVSIAVLVFFGALSATSTANAANGDLSVKVIVDKAAYAYPKIQLVKVVVAGSEQSRFVDTRNQTCPYDYTADCYSTAGTFIYHGVSKGSWIVVCVVNPKNSATNCDGYHKTTSNKLTVHIEALY